MESVQKPRREALRELLGPDLPDGKPASVGVAQEKLLAAASGTIEASHDAEQHSSPCRSQLRRDRAPHGGAAGLEAGVPHGPALAGLGGVEEHDLFFGDGVPRSGAAGAILGREE
jgi:hypothetical protein